MELSKKDRVILINQYRILSHLDPDSSSRYEELIEILESGYTIFYSMVDDYVSEEMSVDEGHFVTEILNIYRHIEDYKRKNPDDQEVAGHPYAVFPGFDGNEEGKFFGFVRFLIEKQGNWGEQKRYWRETDGLNSHAPMVSKYERMIAKWKESGGGYDFDRERVLEILKA